MEIRAYDFDNTKPSQLLSLVDSLYQPSSYREEYKASISNNLWSNPFFKHGKIKNFLALQGEIPRGHASSIIDPRIPKIGFIGFFECTDKDAARELLKTSIQWLKEQGIKIIRAPINLSIWDRYRFMVARGHDDLFLFEPFNLEEYPKYFKDYGFVVAETYASGVRTEYENIINYSEPGYKHAVEKRFTIRNIDLSKFDEELKIFHSLSLEIFKNSWSFVPISFDEFKLLYKDFDRKLDPNYCQFICKDDRVIGFCFSIPDFFSTKKQLIMKTIGVLPSYQNQNLGSALIYSQHMKAKKDGYETIIYALLREGNVASKINPYGATFFRKYETYELAL